MVTKKSKARKAKTTSANDKKMGRYEEVAIAVIEVNRKALEALKDK